MIPYEDLRKFASSALYVQSLRHGKARSITLSLVFPPKLSIKLASGSDQSRFDCRRFVETEQKEAET